MRTFGFLAALIAVVGATSYISMIAFGIVHSYVHVFPAFSYLETVALLIAFRLFFFRAEIRGS